MYIIEKCKLQQKPFYLQTNILKSMTTRVKPTVTEISNLTYSVEVGFDGLILKEELTTADNYIDIVKCLEENLLQIESFSEIKPSYEELSKYYNLNRGLIVNRNIETLLDCAVKSTFDVPVGIIILNSNDFQLAKGLSKYRPNSLIIFVTSNKAVFDYLRLIRGVTPLLMETFYTLENNEIYIEHFCKR